ncbi:hypothetical protein RhiirC2_797597 [Rhizophagus irregularis]|uniref:Uncharacterized protein n=1 Tax=Rhizophagus irregularis TaxID=588596 RepID=A0A2N1M7S6_9GLOM|nr:hypothetical protein RhiirC2_797597 [Rhizophagus irregularis]
MKDIPLGVSLESGKFIFNKTINNQEEVKEIINNHVEIKENARNSNDQFVKQIEDYKLMLKTCQSWIL